MKISWAWWRVPVVPATWEAEAGESLEGNHLNLGSGGCGEPRSHHCTAAEGSNRVRLCLKKNTKKQQTDVEGQDLKLRSER